MNLKKNMNSSTKNNNYNKNNDSSKIFINENNSKNENNNDNDISKNKTLTKNKKIKITVIDDLYSKPCNSLNLNIANTDMFDIFEEKTPNFPLSYYFFGHLLNKISSKNDNHYACISQKFNISYSFFTHIIDITSYISLYQQFESLKKLVLKECKKKSIENKNEDIYANRKNDFKIFNKILKNNLTFQNT